MSYFLLITKFNKVEQEFILSNKKFNEFLILKIVFFIAMLVQTWQSLKIIKYSSILEIWYGKISLHFS